MADILVIDDRDDVRDAICRILGSAGHESAASSTAAAALRLVSVRRFDAVVIDAVTLGGDGVDFIPRLRAGGLGPHAPVLATSRNHDPEARVAVLGRGADDVLIKPFDGRELLARVRGLLDAAAWRRARDLHDGTKDYRDELLGMLVHDLKSPITVIIGNLEYLTEELARGGGAAATVEAVADAADAATALHRMVGNLLDVGRAESGHLPLYVGLVRLDEVTEAVARGRAREARMQGITFEVAPSGVELDADLWVVRRMIDNIVDNALRYTPPGGRIRIDAAVEGGRVHVRVANTGTPIPPEQRERLFDKYGQLGPGSSSTRHNIGLGLYFCRLAAEAHGGKIHVEETAEFPTMFVIDLPGPV